VGGSVVPMDAIVPGRTAADATTPPGSAARGVCLN
jgi:hypothetical protein